MILTLQKLLSAPTSGIYPASFKRTAVKLLSYMMCGSVGEGGEVVEMHRDNTIKCAVSVLAAVGGATLKLISDGVLSVSCELWLFCHCFQTSAAAGCNHRCLHVTVTRSERRSAVSCYVTPPPVLRLICMLSQLTVYCSWSVIQMWIPVDSANQ